jgi:cell division ATPase FtsA
MTVAAPWVRGVYELAEPRRIEREDMVYTVRKALRLDGETILNSAMEWKVDGEPTSSPLDKVGTKLEVRFRAVVVKGAV